MKQRRAFTLIELFAAIAVVVVFIALLLPALRGVIDRARGMVGYSNLRTHAQIFTLYTEDYAGTLPYITEPGLLSTLLPRGSPGGIPASFFDAHQYWHLELAGTYYSENYHSDVFQVPSVDDELYGVAGIRTPYFYPCAFIADPDYWNLETRIGPRQFGPTMLGDVVFASRKALIVQSQPFLGLISDGDLLVKLPVAAADGSARPVAPIERAAGYPRGDGPQFQAAGAVHFGDSPPLLHTLNGVRGIDILNR